MKSSTVLVVRPDGHFSSILRDEGFDVVNLGLIRAEPLEDLSEADSVLTSLESYDGLFFTSPMSAGVFGERVMLKRPDYHGKIYALGERARKVLTSLGFDVVFKASANTAEDLIRSFEASEFAGKRFLYVRGDKSLRTIPELLDGRAAVDEIVVYRTLEVEAGNLEISDVRKRLSNGGFDWICFFSPSGVDSFLGRFEANGASAAAIGETTAAHARNAGFQVDFVSPTANAHDFARELARHIKNIE